MNAADASAPSDAQDEVTIAGDAEPTTVRRTGQRTSGALQVEPAASSQSATGISSQCAWLFAEGCGVENISLDEVPTFFADAEPPPLVWVDLSRYAADELRTVGTLLALPRGALRAMRSSWQRPRLSVYPDSFSVSATVPHLDPETYHVLATELDLFIGRGLLVSAHKQALPFQRQLMVRAKQGADYAADEMEGLRLDAMFLLYVMLDELLAHYENLGTDVENELEALEEQALRAPPHDFLERLLRFKRYIFTLYQLAEQHRAVFAAFLRPDFRWATDDDVKDYFEDLEERLARLLDALGAAREAANGAFDLYVSHLSHRTNQVIKVLTLASTVLFTASVVIALFGATVQGVSSNGPFAFEAMLAVLAIVTACVVVVFRWRGWI